MCLEGREAARTVNDDLQKAEPPRHVLLAQIIRDEDPLDHEADIVDTARDLLPKVLREGLGDVHDGAV